MRDYLYIWRDSASECIIASGLEFSDFLTYFEHRKAGVMLLKHKYSEACEHPVGLEFVHMRGLTALSRDDIYDYGDFLWIDLPGVIDGDSPLAEISDKELSEMLFFGHTGQPLGHVSFESIGNQFLAATHDDGWSLRLYGCSWNACEELISTTLKERLDTETAEKIIGIVEQGSAACLFRNGQIQVVKQTRDLNSIP